MSYYCEISFKKIEPAEIIQFFKNIKKVCGERIEEIAKTEYSYCPYIQRDLDVPNNFSAITLDKRQEAMDWANNSIFKFKYFYDAELKLLGVFGVTNVLKNLFDKTVVFQNSTDQDYEMQEWEGIECFENIFDKYTNMSDDQVKIEYKRFNNDDFDKDYEEYANSPEKIKEKLDYVRRSLCYKEIWSRYEDYLWKPENSIYFAIYGYEERAVLMRLVKACHEKQVQWQEEFEREWNKKHV